jgi:hypothetical protein
MILMRLLSTGIIFLLLTMLMSACEKYKVKDFQGPWQVDQVLLDGMDRTGWPLEEFPWGSGLELKADGSFRTNFARTEEASGKWRLGSGRDKLFLQRPSADQTTRFDVTLSGDQLVLKSLRWQVFLSRAEVLPEPEAPEVNLASNILGTWYFYEMNTQDSLILYPKSRKKAHWVSIDRSGFYRSGEGPHESFHGRWLLKEDTLVFSEIGRAWKEQWKVRWEEDRLYFESLEASQDRWYEVSLVHESLLAE